MRSRPRSLALLVLAVACGPRALEPATGRATTTGTGEPEDLTVEVSGAATDATGSTSVPEPTTTFDDTATTGDTDLFDCRPWPENRATVDLLIELGVGVGPKGTPRRCTVETALASASGVRLSFTCLDGEGTERITLETEPPIAVPLAPGDDVTIRHVTLEDPPGWVHTYLRVDRANFGHVFTYIESNTFTPEGVAFPLPLARIVPVISCADGIWTPCGDRDRVGLEFQARPRGDTPTLLFELEHATLRDAPNIDVWVPLAAVVDPKCAVPDQWYRVLVATRP